MISCSDIGIQLVIKSQCPYSFEEVKGVLPKTRRLEIVVKQLLPEIVLEELNFQEARIFEYLGIRETQYSWLWSSRS